MNFQPTEERRMLQDSLRRFLTDAQGDVWAGLADLGVIGALFPEDQGGYGGAGFDLAVVFEELGRADSDAALLDQALLPGLMLAAAGGDLAPLIAGQQRLALAHGEVDARYDLGWVETQAKGDRLTGAKSVVMGADGADALLVTARHDGAPDDAHGIGLWRVAPDAPGLRMQAYATMDGGRAAEITLDDVAAEPLMDQAYEALTQAHAAACVAQTAQTLGAMDAAMALTRDYLATRRQFGRPIGSFQALAHRLADMAVALEQMRSGVILAAGHLGAAPPERDRHIAAAKNIAGRAGRLIAEEAVQMHGGIGMTEEYALGRLARRIIMADHRFGDTDHHLERFIALSA